MVFKIYLDENVKKNIALLNIKKIILYLKKGYNFIIDYVNGVYFFTLANKS